MKGFISFIILIAIIVAGYLILHESNDSLSQIPNTDEMAAVADADQGNSSVDETFTGIHDFDTSASSANWTGSKTLLKDYFDHGTINIKTGQAEFTDGKLTGGNITFDMNSIATTSTGRGDDSNTTSMQVKHMKSADFFDVSNFPEANFTITNVAQIDETNYNLTGDLMIKGKTNSVTFPIAITTENGVAVIEGSATLDRTLWNIRYGSSKFFPNVGDQVIGDMFTLDFKVVTK
jgi:polyisoprenoid-binding protein YceI